MAGTVVVAVAASVAFVVAFVVALVGTVASLASVASLVAVALVEGLQTHSHRWVPRGHTGHTGHRNSELEEEVVGFAVHKHHLDLHNHNCYLHHPKGHLSPYHSCHDLLLEGVDSPHHPTHHSHTLHSLLHNHKHYQCYHIDCPDFHLHFLHFVPPDAYLPTPWLSQFQPEIQQNARC